MTTFNVVRPDSLPDSGVACYRESIDTYQRYIDGDTSIGLVDTVEMGNGFRALYPLSREKATEILIRELRRYADYLENFKT